MLWAGMSRGCSASFRFRRLARWQSALERLCLGKAKLDSAGRSGIPIGYRPAEIEEGPVRSSLVSERPTRKP